MQAKERRNPMAVTFEFDPEKAIAASVYIVSKGLPELTMAKLFKLLFLSDKDHLVRYGRPIMGDFYAAMKDGPVPSNLYDLFKEMKSGEIHSEAGALIASKIALTDLQYQYPRLKVIGDLDPMQLSESDIESLDRIIQEYGQSTFLRLRALTHETPAYENAWESRGSSDMKPMVFEDFFEEDPDAVAGAKEEMIENSALRSVFSDIGIV
jgi:uncharacterized phage-associated protein